MQVFPASLYPNAICLETTVHTIPTLTTVTSPSYHKNIDWATVTGAAMGKCAVLWYYTGQATVSLADCMSSWAGCCPGAWPLLPVAGSCHLLLVPVCQTELSRIINTVHYTLKLSPCPVWSQSHGSQLCCKSRLNKWKEPKLFLTSE